MSTKLLLLRVYSCLPRMPDIYQEYPHFVKNVHLKTEERASWPHWHQHCTLLREDLFWWRCHQRGCRCAGNFSPPDTWLFLILNQGRPKMICRLLKEFMWLIMTMLLKTYKIKLKTFAYFISFYLILFLSHY